VADEGRHHVQGTTGVPFGHRLEVFGGQWQAIQIHPPGVGHVGDNSHPGAGQSVSGDKHGIELFLVLHPPAGDQLAGQRSDTFASLLAVTYGTISGLPQIVGVGVSAHGWYSLWSLFDVFLCSSGRWRRRRGGGEAWLSPLRWPASSTDQQLLAPPGVTSGYAIRVIAFRTRSNDPADITAPIRARARKGFQTVSSPAPR